MPRSPWQTAAIRTNFSAHRHKCHRWSCHNLSLTLVDTRYSECQTPSNHTNKEVPSEQRRYAFSFAEFLVSSLLFFAFHWLIEWGTGESKTVASDCGHSPPFSCQNGSAASPRLARARLWSHLACRILRLPHTRGWKWQGQVGGARVDDEQEQLAEHWKWHHLALRLPS